MKIIKTSERTNPKVSLILLDWNVRESFHFLKYLSTQSLPRDQFEVILVEYYSGISKAAQDHRDQIDCWMLLQMPEDLYYHKHLMYNAGIIASRGEICVICDSDAMARPTFIKTIIDEFEKNKNLVLHIDQFRNQRQDFYPFNYPSFDEVLGEGCKNNINGQTKGLVEKTDPLHNRNYGACMCAPRSKLIKIGGADEHIDYLGHICGPYDMTFRLVNDGLKEIWHEEEFTMHTWHPGAAGVDNYLGPHDGRHVSTTSIAALNMGQTEPFVINPAISMLRDNGSTDSKNLLGTLINPQYLESWKRVNLDKLGKHYFEAKPSEISILHHRGFRVTHNEGKTHGFIVGKSYNLAFLETDQSIFPISGTFSEVIKKLNRALTLKVTILLLLTRFCFKARLGLAHLQHYIATRYYFAKKSLSAQNKKSSTTKRRSPKVKDSYQITSLKKRFRHFATRIDQFNREASFLCEGLDRLILFLLTYQNKLRIEKKSVLYVHSRSVKLWTTFLGNIRLLPKMEIRLIENLDDVHVAFGEEKTDNTNKQLLISSLLFSRFYSIIAEFKKRTKDNVIVI
ncbi:MAG: hypothetical protein CMK56_05535 [Proteobacteria bacterium]|nr:hypothetical protein [Pseudomonadota bacterium]